VEPAYAAGEDGIPVEIARLQQRGGFVRAIVEHDRRAHAVAAITVHSGHVRAVDAVVLETLVKGLHTHGAHALRHQLADWIVDHGAGDAGVQVEGVGQIGRDVEFATADVDLAFRGLAEGNDAGVDAVHERAQGDDVQSAVGTDIQACHIRYSC